MEVNSFSMWLQFGVYPEYPACWAGLKHFSVNCIVHSCSCYFLYFTALKLKVIITTALTEIYCIKNSLKYLISWVRYTIASIYCLVDEQRVLLKHNAYWSVVVSLLFYFLSCLLFSLFLHWALNCHSRILQETSLKSKKRAVLVTLLFLNKRR